MKRPASVNSDKVGGGMTAPVKSEIVMFHTPVPTDKYISWAWSWLTDSWNCSLQQETLSSDGVGVVEWWKIAALDLRGTFVGAYCLPHQGWWDGLTCPSTPCRLMDIWDDHHDITDWQSIARSSTSTLCLVGNRGGRKGWYTAIVMVMSCDKCSLHKMCALQLLCAPKGLMRGVDRRMTVSTTYWRRHKTWATKER
jgi:hypothetical protein